MTKRGEATRQKILDAAVTLYAEGGFRAVRIAQICERACVSPTSVYWHFDNKSELIQAALETAFEPIGEEMLSKSTENKDVDAFLRHLENLVLKRPVGALTMLAYVADNLNDPDLEQGISKTRRNELKGQTKLLAQLLELDRNSAKEIGILINACVNYAGLVELSGGTNREVKEVIQALRGVLLNPGKQN